MQFWNPNNPCDECGAMSVDSHEESCSEYAQFLEEEDEERSRCKAAHPSNTKIPCHECGPGYNIGDDGCRHTHPKKEEKMIETTRYAKVPFFVDAVQVNNANMEEVSNWCDGEIITETETGEPCEAYIKVDVKNPLSEQQTRAVIGSWILKAATGINTGYKVYGNKAFLKNFEATDEPKTMIFPKKKDVSATQSAPDAPATPQEPAPAVKIESPEEPIVTEEKSQQLTKAPAKDNK